MKMPEASGAFQAGNTGSNPVGDTRVSRENEGLAKTNLAPFGLSGPDSSPQPHHGPRTYRPTPVGHPWRRGSWPSFGPRPAVGESVVYFIGSLLAGCVKVGTSIDAVSRLATLQLSSPLPLYVFLWIPGDAATESALHEELAAHSSHGEWFAPLPPVWARINEARLAENARRLAADGPEAFQWPEIPAQFSPAGVTP